MSDVIRNPRGELIIRTQTMPADTNQNGDIFGGWIMSQMDLAGGMLATEIARGRIATVAVEGMTFHKPVKVGDAVCVHDPGKIRTILDRTNLRQNARILDVGCGTGILESYLLPYEPRQIVAIDIAGQMIEKARMKYPDHPLIEFLQEDAMSYEGKGFDYIILYSAYPHFMRPERLIEHMSGLLAPGGKLVICHSESKEKINTHHHRHADRLSLPLPPAREVAALMEPYLLPLVVEDTEQLYIVCGKRLS